MHRNQDKSIKEWQQLKFSHENLTVSQKTRSSNEILTKNKVHQSGYGRSGGVVARWRRPEASRTSLNVLIIRLYCHYGSLPSLIVHAGTHRNCLKFLNDFLFQICDPGIRRRPNTRTFCKRLYVTTLSVNYVDRILWKLLFCCRHFFGRECINIFLVNFG